MKETVIKGTPVVITRQLPFTPDEDDLLYVEGHHTIKVERWRIVYYQDIINSFLDLPENYKAGYFQLIVEMLKSPVFWVYFSQKERSSIEAELIDRFDFQEFLPEECLEPALYALDARCADGSCRMMQYKVGRYGLRKTLAFVLERMTRRDWEAGLEYEKCCDAEDEKTDFAALLRQAAEGLRAEGMTDADIIALVRGEQKVQHYLHISGRYEISVSSGKDGERAAVHMSPLDKAVYILFLNHAEGIRFCDLPDMREELMDIYMKLMDYRTMPDMRSSVNAVTDPAQNSINEKCARIRRSFRNILGAASADEFCIMGRKGEAKRISADRRFVEWEKG